MHCYGVGISGRTVVAEIIWMDERGRRFIQPGNLLEWTQYLKKQGWQPYQHQLMNYVKNGFCDPLDAEKLMGEIGLEIAAVNFEYVKD